MYFWEKNGRVLIDTMNLDLALVHYPVYNKSGEIITSAVCNLDLHDIARAAKTYGIGHYFVVTPLKDQRELAKRIVGHWTQGSGGPYNPDRKDALELIQVVSSLDQAMEILTEKSGCRPLTVVTDARPHPRNVTYSAVGEMVRAGRPLLLVFGTAWGLTKEFIDEADLVLAPIVGHGLYNHLSVRSASSIILDRLTGLCG
jgi:hypothetical protein